jgi:hypothetical protein
LSAKAANNFDVACLKGESPKPEAHPTQNFVFLDSENKKNVTKFAKYLI